MESANPSVQLNSAGASLVEDVRLERGAAPAPQRQSGQNRIGEIERLSPQIERMLLDKIRDKMMYELGVTKESVTGISISDTETRTFRFHFGSAVNETVELGWLTEMGIKKAARIEQAFRDAWPEDRKWSKAYVVESDGRSPAVLAHWSSVGKVYQDDLKAIYQNRNLPPANPLYPGYEGLWHSWCYAARAALKERRERMVYLVSYCSSNSQKKGDQHHPINLLAWALSYDEPFSKSCHDQNSFRVGYSASFFSPNFRGGCNVPGGHPEQHAIHWQIRYFRPISDYTCSDMDCLLSKRQAATIRHGSEAICLGERRARVSFRVLRGTPGLFSILSLSDDWMPIGKKDFQNIDKVKASWERYGLMARERAIPITHYLFEICRIFERCMDAWGETLDAIDGLVHVDLNDFDDQSRVEDLMFDKSFNRSKDYFVALQLLRIVDEWLDEIVPSVKELQKDPSLGHPSFCAAAARENFNAAIRSIDERAGAVQRRVRKKVEEINSLRDGLFNATSLRESTKAMALNQAIYVFTIVTVLFTPVSFLAVSDIHHKPSASQLTK
ncbi:uncharacterized protein BKA55DRAFT_518677 [Fusarium redolens]|uniref:Uncharacterized protein n=1 Tax=Fusarium redolens TaxID=48865 RepID=A0A9P9GML0_FUSRE|nr:uncharacterized protein BKA55DRAFT_518677 [Fusarium redolens]KAH7240744.1 hypothetical protein BKA55DRAFT_518677 [Fusarium redolens]